MNNEHDNVARAAADLFDNGCSCSESVLGVFCFELGLDPDMARKIASGFAGGMGLMGQTCGVVTAAYMVLGLALGPDRIDDRESRMEVHRLVRAFAEKFKAEHGSLDCRDLCPEGERGTPEHAMMLRQSGVPQRLIMSSIGILSSIKDAAKPGGREG